MTIYTRIRYCPECAKAFRPHLGEEMVRDEDNRLKLFDNKGRVLTVYDGQFYYKERGLFFELPDSENVYYRSVRLKNPTVETCAHADWNALLKSECEL